MTAALYYANSLEQIATLFDQQREQALRRCAATLKQKERLTQTAYAVTWRDAAMILRATSFMTHAGWRYRFNPTDAWTLVNDRPTGIPPTGEIEELFA